MTAAGHASWRQQQRRKDLVFAGLLCAGLVAIALIAFWVQGLSRDLHTAVEDRDALARQVEELGETPVAGPAGSRGEPGASVTGPPGEQGVQGPAGVAGPTGPPGPSGSPGAAGRDGDDGVSGIEGTPGAAGATGPAGPQGVQGERGEQGATGPQGERGPAGPACPDGYSLQAPASDPDVLVCRRDGAPSPGGDPGGSPRAVGLDPLRRLYG
ncbi:collagen-like protein [Streptomyces sp. NPDC004539]|uniref:collagen-like protein n=1 Tax=Streptomyces sp. NPDC004539 TaxID=3154280 RepID=UPI0033AD0A6C